MKVLWPRGYVDESNLTKHIWVIRRSPWVTASTSRDSSKPYPSSVIASLRK